MSGLKFKDIKFLLVETAKRWMAADPFRESATISYYAIFSIPGLLIIIIWTAGVFFGSYRPKSPNACLVPFLHNQRHRQLWV